MRVFRTTLDMLRSMKSLEGTFFIGLLKLLKSLLPNPLSFGLMEVTYIASLLNIDTFLFFEEELDIRLNFICICELVFLYLG